MQQIALGWLVYGMTRSASLLGAVGFCGNMPILVLGLVGGAIADRASRRTIMLGSQVVIGLAALSLALLTATGHLAVWHVIAIAMVAGTASALWGPAMQAVVPSLVGPEELLNAISLNSVQFNLARTLRPAGAGRLYGRIGPAGGFAVNRAGLLFGAVLGTFVVVRSVRGTALLFFVMGILQTVCVASLNTTIQLAVDDGMRGRIMSMMTVILFGFATTGGLVVGLLGDHIGVPSALAAGGVIIMIAAIALFVRAPELVGGLPRAVEA